MYFLLPFCGEQRKRASSRRWAPADEDVTGGDLGLGEVAQLDICTGTAEDKASCASGDPNRGCETRGCSPLFTVFIRCGQFCH